MRHRFIRSTIAPFAMAAVLCLSATAASSQAPAYRAPRSADGHADLNGIWQALNEAYWDIEGHAAAPGLVTRPGCGGRSCPGPGVVEGGPLPYQPAAAAQKRQNFENRLTAGPGDQVLSAGRAARHLYALSVPDPSDPKIHHDGLHVRACSPHDLHGRPRGCSRRQLDGMVERALGGRDAGRRYHGLQRAGLVRPGREFPQRRFTRGRTVHSPRAPTISCMKPPSRTRKCSRDRGR